MKYTSLCENHLFQKAYKNGQKAPGSKIVLYVLADRKANLLKKRHPLKLKINRVGITVSKKIGGAVQRNRAKRIIRAAYDPIKPNLKTGFLIVISAREAINGKKSTDVARELQKAFSSLNMLIAPEGANKQTP